MVFSKLTKVVKRLRYFCKKIGRYEDFNHFVICV